MEKVLDVAKTVIAAIGGFFSLLFGAWDTLIFALVIVVTMDYITGVANAAIKHELSSAVGFKGLWKKVTIFLIVAIGTLADSVIPATNGAVRTAVILYYIANEALSILENAAEMGIPLPSVLTNALEKMKQHGDAAEEPPDDAHHTPAV